MTKTIKRFREVEITVEFPNSDKIRKHNKFREGQNDRKSGNPCKSSNGAYLDGWYQPDKKAYFITEDQADAFNL